MKVFLRSFGCSTNTADGEALAGCLENAGYKMVESLSSASVVIYNTCAVKEPTENRMIHFLKKVPPSKKLIIAGCLPLINPDRLTKEVRFDGLIGPSSGAGIVDLVRKISKGERVVDVHGSNALPKLDLPRLRSNPAIGIIPISYGCLGSCAYCCVARARGSLRSYRIEEIVDRARKDIEWGIRELWITSQDTGCYGKDIGTNLAELIDNLCTVKGEFKIRVGMMTPNSANDLLPDLIAVFRDEHVYKFVHLPVQSGDDQILVRMRRDYSAEAFTRIVSAFRSSFPKITLSTDVICGFPGETEEDFRRTVQLIEDIKPDIVNVSRFFARPKTLAAEMQKVFVPLSEIKCRSRTMTFLAKRIALKRNKRWIGWTGRVLADEVGKDPGSWICRNSEYKPIAIRCKEWLLGESLNAKVVGAFPTHLAGTILE